MPRTLTLLVCLALLARLEGQPVPKAAATLPEEKEVERHVLARAYEPKTVRFVRWGPHDLDGKLAGAVKKWRDATKRPMPATAMGGAVEILPGDRFVYVVVNELTKDSRVRFNIPRIYLLRGGKVVAMDELNTRTGVPSGRTRPWWTSFAPNWLDAELKALANPLGE